MWISAHVEIAGNKTTDRAAREATGWTQKPIIIFILRTTPMTMSTSVVIVTTSFPSGRWRNFGFSCLGLASLLGFSVGLVTGGLLQETVVGWRLGFYVCGTWTVVLAVVNGIVIPKSLSKTNGSLWYILKSIDWVGLLMSSVSLGCFSYSFA